MFNLQTLPRNYVSLHFKKPQLLIHFSLQRNKPVSLNVVVGGGWRRSLFTISRLRGKSYSLFREREVTRCNPIDINIARFCMYSTRNCIYAKYIRGFFITIWTQSTENSTDTMRLIFGINEIDCYDYRGDRIRTCDLVLPKHPVRNLRQTPQETSEAIAS